MINRISCSATYYLLPTVRCLLPVVPTAACYLSQVYNELHGSGKYAKGKGREFTAWLEKHYGADFYMGFERAEGSRQDIAFDGAVAIFMMRKVVLEFIQGLMVPGADNRLEKFLLRVLSCGQVTAALRVNTLFKYMLSEPTRWLAGKAGELGWGLDDSSEMVDLVEKFMMEVAADGSKLFDASYDPWAPIAAKNKKFADWRTEYFQRTAKSLDKTAQHAVHGLTLDEARNPVGQGNIDATDRTVSLAQEMANAALVAMRDPRRAICGLLVSQDGKFSAGKDPRRNKATAGTHHTNDRVESNFGCVDLLMRMFRCATPSLSK